MFKILQGKVKELSKRIRARIRLNCLISFYYILPLLDITQTCIGENYLLRLFLLNNNYLQKYELK